MKIINLTGDIVNYIRIRFYIIKVLLVVVLTLVVLIGIKANSTFKANFYRYVYDTNISFAKNFSIYKKYFGNIFETTKVNPVFNEKIVYEEKEAYLDGVKLKVGEAYVLKAMKAGIIVDIDKTNDYGQCLTVQQMDDIEVSYCNVSNINGSLYDYVDQGQILGEVDDILYLIYKKDGIVLDYEEYLP